MATRRTRKRPLERRFEEGPFLSLGMPYAHGGLRNARTVILLFVASYAERRSPLYLGLLYFIFGQNGKHLAHRRRPSILRHSFSPLSPLFLLPIERRLLSTVPRCLVFYLFFSLSLRLSLPSTDSLCPSIHSVSQLFDPFSSARWCCHLSNLSIILLYSFLYLFRFSVLFSEHGSTNG